MAWFKSWKSNWYVGRKHFYPYHPLIIPSALAKERELYAIRKLMEYEYKHSTIIHFMEMYADPLFDPIIDDNFPSFLSCMTIATMKNLLIGEKKWGRNC
jgi:hypothetical protein